MTFSKENKKPASSMANGIKKYFVLFALLFNVSYALAADGDNQNLQQQLQTLQDSLQATSQAPQKPTEAAAPSSYNSPMLVTPTPAASQVPAGAPPLNDNAPPALNGAPPVGASPTAPAAGNGIPAGDDDLRSQAFGSVVNNVLPLSPAQIRMLRGMYDATQQAAVSFPGVPPRPTATSIAVNLSPGAVPPVVRLGAGFVTSLVFVDATGAPWPIDSYSLGNPTAFNIQWDKKSNILLVQAITAHRMGNLAVILKGLNTPVMIDLNPGQAALDVRVDLRIPGAGPTAKPSVEELPGTESPALLALLDGIPPPGAKPLKSSACESCAWLAGKKLYLRSQFTLLSPAWLSTMASADGTHVYELQPTPLVLVSYNGKTIKMKLEGF